MTATDRAPVRLLSIALLITVASQLFYITVVPAAGPETVLRPAIWFGELFAFLSIALAAFTLAIRRPDQAVLWVTLAIAGILNVLQVAVGYSKVRIWCRKIVAGCWGLIAGCCSIWECFSTRCRICPGCCKVLQGCCGVQGDCCGVLQGRCGRCKVVAGC